MLFCRRFRKVYFPFSGLQTYNAGTLTIVNLKWRHKKSHFLNHLGRKQVLINNSESEFRQFLLVVFNVHCLVGMYGWLLFCHSLAQAIPNIGRRLLNCTGKVSLYPNTTTKLWQTSGQQQIKF